MIPSIGTFANKAVDFLTEIAAFCSHFLNEGIQSTRYNLTISKIFLSSESSDIFHLVGFAHDIDGLVVPR